MKELIEKLQSLGYSCFIKKKDVFFPSVPFNFSVMREGGLDDYWMCEGKPEVRIGLGGSRVPCLINPKPNISVTDENGVKWEHSNIHEENVLLALNTHGVDSFIEAMFDKTIVLEC